VKTPTLTVIDKGVATFMGGCFFVGENTDLDRHRQGRSYVYGWVGGGEALVFQNSLLPLKYIYIYIYIYICSTKRSNRIFQMIQVWQGLFKKKSFE
jgi:hypothetical protein